MAQRRRPRRRWRALRLPAACLLALSFAGCATYSQKLADLRPLVSRGAHDEALAAVAKGTGGKDVPLAFLERGLILHRARLYAESNEAFAAAERTTEELYATSLSEGAISLFTNDLAISYRARPFEMAMVPYYRALNYLALGDRESAMVEARKTSLLLARYVDATVAGIERGPVADLQRIRNDPFMLYFAGMLYDSDGELNDAFIAYRNAAAAYEDLHGLLELEIPGWLGWDLERTGGRLGFGDELLQLRESCPAVFAAASALAAADPSPATGRPPAGEGEVVLLVETGYAPIKRESKLHLPVLASDAAGNQVALAWALAARADGAYVRADAARVRYWLTVAVPRLQSTPAVARHLRAAAAGAAGFGARAHHPAAAAQITFAAEQPMIIFKTAMRGLAKYFATRQADKQDRAFGILANIFGAATEVADTRSWLTLPEQIHLIRLRLPAGAHDLALELQDDAGRTIGTAVVPAVVVRRGEWTFASHRVFDR